MDTIRISVAMATYNGEKYIEKQLVSILNNICENDEIIISDDGSTDSTLEIIKKLNKGNIKVIKGPKKGVMKNFENAIKNCRGEFIFLSDQDDIWAAGKVENVLKLFEKGVTAVVHDVSYINEKDEIMYKSFFEKRRVRSGLVNNLIKNSYLGNAMCFRGDLKEKVIPIPVDKRMSDQWHDQWIGLVCEAYGKVVFDKQVLGYYRRHSSNVSSGVRGSIPQMIYNRIVIGCKLIERFVRNIRVTRKYHEENDKD